MKQLFTKWAKEADPDHILQEYPRPQFVRTGYTSLNGRWQYAFTGSGEKPHTWDGTILVPFSPETALSGVERQLQPEERLWYHRQFSVPEHFRKSRWLLHFGAVDQSCAVYVNGRKLCTHEGGYTPFSVEMTESLRSGANSLTVCVKDGSDTTAYGRGKQKLRRGGMYYTATSGIWQSVWMEEVPPQHIAEIRADADADTGEVTFAVTVSRPLSEKGENARETPSLSITVFEPGLYQDEEFPYEAVLGKCRRIPSCDAPEGKWHLEAPHGEPLRLTISDKKLWSPETPYLYYALVECGEDRVITYFAYRKITLENEEDGTPRVRLNHQPYFQRGVLDQGYWPDGLYTPPADDAFVFDIREMKNTGFNMARKHAKVEAERWYYHCDRLGLLVWQDMVNGGEKYRDWYVTYLATAFSALKILPKDTNRKLLARQSAEGRAQFEKEMEETVRALKAHPCIAVWVLFNEGWGQFDTVRLTEKLRNLDPTRLIDSASGWFDENCGDFISIHHYFFRLPWRTDGKRAVVLSEIGGYAFHDAAHSACEKTYGYRTYDTPKALNEAVLGLLQEREALERKGLSGYVYTQWSDIEEEVNGVYTYDREVRKIREHGVRSL